MRFELNLDAFSTKTPPMLGLDVSTTSVKLVELADAGKGTYRLERYVVVPLPKDAVSDGNIASIEQVVAVVKTAWKDLGSRVRHVVMALPTSAVITKKIMAPAGLGEIELENQVEAEANQAIPFSLDEVNLDFQVLGPVPNSPNDVQVLLVAARKEKVEDRVAVAEGAGLRPLVMDVESYATVTSYQLIANLLPNRGAGQTVAILDIGANNMHVNVLYDNEPVYLREHGFGAQQLNQEIARRYGMTSEEADQAKRRGTLPDSYDAEVLQPYAETLAMEVARALQLFTTSTQFHKVDQILLAGGGAAIPALDEVVANRTGVPTIIANPFSNMALGNKVKPQELTRDAPALFVACGLAMRRFDPQ